MKNGVILWIEASGLEEVPEAFFVSARVKCDLYYCSSPNYGLLLPIT